MNLIGSSKEPLGGLSAKVGVLVSVAGDSRLILEVLRSAAAWYDVTGLADYSRGVVNLEQFMDALSDEDVRDLVGSAREEALMERSRRNLVVDRERSSFLPWTGEHQDLPQRGLLSRVMRPSLQSRLAVQASLEATPPPTLVLGGWILVGR